MVCLCTLGALWIETPSVGFCETRSSSIAVGGAQAATDVDERTAGAGRQTALAVYADGRDRWNLLRQSTVNRSLRAQGADYRQFLDEGRFSGAIDGTIGWQQPIGTGPQTRFHGYYVLDTYVAFRALDQMTLNLNFTVFNPSASDGYRTSADILTGFTLELKETFEVGGYPLRIDIL
ncbi:MAG: hypothetical protein AAF449_15140, partial [Myxococcota bacterium]